jgi:hypothetical protein
MPKGGYKGQIEGWCFRCHWKGGCFVHLEDALAAMKRHTSSAKHGEAVELVRRAA